MLAKRELVLNIAMNIIGPYIPSPISTFFNARVTYKFKVLSFIQRKNHFNNMGPVSQRFPKVFPKIELKICRSYNLGGS